MDINNQESNEESEKFQELIGTDEDMQLAEILRLRESQKELNVDINDL